MITFIVTIVVLTIALITQSKFPLIAGFIAVIPIKILSTAIMGYEHAGLSHMREVIGGMLVGQTLWAFMLVVVYLYIGDNL